MSRQLSVMTFVGVRMEADIVVALDAYAAEHSLSRSGAVRKIIAKRVKVAQAEGTGDGNRDGRAAVRGRKPTGPFIIRVGQTAKGQAVFMRTSSPYRTTTAPGRAKRYKSPSQASNVLGRMCSVYVMKNPGIEWLDDARAENKRAAN